MILGLDFLSFKWRKQRFFDLLSTFKCCLSVFFVEFLFVEDWKLTKSALEFLDLLEVYAKWLLQPV